MYRIITDLSGNLTPSKQNNSVHVCLRTYKRLLFCLCVNMPSGTQKLYGETKDSHYPKFLYVNMKHMKFMHC